MAHECVCDNRHIHTKLWLININCYTYLLADRTMAAVDNAGLGLMFDMV